MKLVFFFSRGAWEGRRECSGVAEAVSAVTLFLVAFGVPFHVAMLVLLVFVSFVFLGFLY